VLIQLYIVKDNIGPLNSSLSNNVALDGKKMHNTDNHTGAIHTPKLTEEHITPFSDSNYAVIGKGIQLKRYTFYEGNSKIC
jgi:hypothetical protein